jgi:hypothetical protein
MLSFREPEVSSSCDMPGGAIFSGFSGVTPGGRGSISLTGILGYTLIAAPDFLPVVMALE